LRQVWLGSEADVLLYMDADLSTELEALPDLVAAPSPSYPERSEVPMSRDCSATGLNGGDAEPRDNASVFSVCSYSPAPMPKAGHD